MIYNVRTLNRIKPTILQCTCDQQRQVSLCIDPLDKASFLHTVRSAKGLNRMCCCCRTVYSALDSPAIDGKYDQRMLLSECAGAYWPESLLVARFVTPSNHRGYLRLAKALIRLLRSADVQSQSVQADPSLRTSFIVGFAMHRLMRELFVQTLTLSTLGTFSADDILKYFSHSSKRTLFALHANCLHCMKRQILFSW